MTTKSDVGLKFEFGENYHSEFWHAYFAAKILE